MLGYRSSAGKRRLRRKLAGPIGWRGRVHSVSGILLATAAAAHGALTAPILAQAEDVSASSYHSGDNDSCTHHGRPVAPIYVVPPLPYARTFAYSTVVPGPVPYAFYYRQQTVWLWHWDNGDCSSGYVGPQGVPYTRYQWQAVPLITTFPLPGLPIGPVPPRTRPIRRDTDPRGLGGIVPGGGAGGDALAANERNVGDDRILQTGWRFLENGDRLFTQGKYREAYGQYRSAAKAVPRLAEAYFRQVFALVAIGAYESAARAAKTGLEMHPEWPKGPFRLDNLYDNDEAAKRAHLARLADAVQQSPQNGDLLFLLGVMLHFDGREEEARTFFAQALPLMAGVDRHVRLFLKD